MDYGGNGLGASSKRGRTAVGVTRIGLGGGSAKKGFMMIKGGGGGVQTPDPP